MNEMIVSASFGSSVIRYIMAGVSRSRVAHTATCTASSLKLNFTFICKDNIFSSYYIPAGILFVSLPWGDAICSIPDFCSKKSLPDRRVVWVFMLPALPKV